MTDPHAGPSDVPRGPASAQALARAWWIPLVSGLVGVIAGLVILIEPHDSLLAIALVLGIYLVVAGILTLIAGLGRDEDRWVVIGFSVLAILAGAFVIARPGSAVHGVRIVFGIYLLIVGLAHIGTIAMPHVDSRGRELLLGVLEIVAGVVFLAVPKLGLAAVALFFGIYLLIRGALEIALALALRDAKHEAGG